MRRTGRMWLTGLALAAPSVAPAQGAKVFCIPGTQACFSATFGFVPTPSNPWYQNRFSSVITNLQGTYGGLNTPFGFLGLGFLPRWNSFSDPRAALGWFDLPSPVGTIRENPLSPGVDFNQPTGGSGYMRMLGSGYMGCSIDPGDLTWSYASCPRDGRNGGLLFGLDLAHVAKDGTMRAATFQHFALQAITTEGSCTFTPSRWLLERRPSDACEERFLANTLTTAGVVPEPGTLLLVATGVSGLALRRLRRRGRGGSRTP